MSSAVYQYEFKTDPTAQFTAALAQNNGIDLDLLMSGNATPPQPTALAGVNGDTRGNLKSLTIISVQNLAWELIAWESATHGTVAAGTVQFIGRWTFVASDGVQIGGAGDFYYYIDGLDEPLVDADKTAKLHFTLVNRSAVSKLANAAGAIQVRGRIAQPVY